MTQRPERAGADHGDVAAPGSRFAIAAWTAHAVGSTITAASSVRSSGTACSWVSWATMNVDQPPPVSLQKPALQPRLEVAERDALAVAESPPAHAGHRRDDAASDAAEHRLDHDAGAVVEIADDLVAGHERERHDRLEVAGRLAVDGRQVAAADAGEPRADAHPARPGQVRRVDVDAAAAGRRGAPARRTSPGHAGRGVARRPCARRGAPSRRAFTTGPPAVGVGDASWRRSCGEGRSGAAAGTLPPTSTIARRSQPRLRAMVGQAGLGVHRDREADRLEHRQVGGGVGVGDRLAEVEAFGVGVVRTAPGPALSPVGGHVDELAGVASRPRSSPRWAQTMSSNRGRSGSTTKSSAPVISTRAVAERAVLAHPADRRRERLREDQRR